MSYGIGAYFQNVVSGRIYEVVEIGEYAGSQGIQKGLIYSLWHDGLGAPLKVSDKELMDEKEWKLALGSDN